MRIKTLSLMAASVAALMSANAQITLEPNENGVILLEASKTGMTRIAFDDDQAASVQKIGEGHPEGDFSATKDPATGDLYVVIGEEAQQNLSFFVSTNAGYTYQVMMRVRDVPTLQVAIAAPKMLEAPRASKPLLNSRVETNAIDGRGQDTQVADLASVLIKAMYSGARVDGFETSRFRKLDWLTGPLAAQGFSQRGVIEWTGNGASGYAITVRNESKEPRVINFGRLAVFNVVAATGEQDVIARRKTGQIFLIVKGQD
ncbi:MAG: type-F conjugative transfer system secretin TraK [Pseudomonadota bacterium]